MKTPHYLFLCLLLLLTSCLDEEENQSCTISIQLVAPTAYTNLPFDQMKVTLTSQSGQGMTYTSSCSSTGLATFRVEPGEYTAHTHYQTPAGIIFNGGVNSFLLLPQAEEKNEPILLSLTHAKSHALVIKEVYYGGCKGKNEKKYVRDQYLTLYNNSDETLYLDGLCVAVIDFQNMYIPSPWITANVARIPVLDCTWQFPGNGTEYPLAAGQETTIATNAVNHTGGTYGHLNSVNLSTVEWAFYNEDFSDQDISLGVNHMNLLSRVGTTIRYQLPPLNLPIMVFSLPGVDAETYVKDPTNWEPCPETEDQNEKYLMVNREWVIDCVECTKDPSTMIYRRVPDELDARPIYMPQGSYVGASLIRRSTLTESGRLKYQDKNNSFDDFIAIPAPTLKQ